MTELEVPDESIWAVVELLRLDYVDMPTVHKILTPVVAAELRKLARSQPDESIAHWLLLRAFETDGPER